MSSTPDLSLIAIVACTPSGVIGLNGGMPWKLGSDLRRFKSLTMGGTLIMGRKTFDSIGKPLPGRETIVLTRSVPTRHEPPALAAGPSTNRESANRDTAPAASAIGLQDQTLHLHWASTVEQVNFIALSLARPTYVVGGAEIYKLFFPFCDELWLTRVLSAVQGDTRIELPLDDFALFELSRHPQTERDSVPTEFQKWRRKNSVPKM